MPSKLQDVPTFLPVGPKMCRAQSCCHCQAAHSRYCCCWVAAARGVDTSPFGRLTHLPPWTSCPLRCKVGCTHLLLLGLGCLTCCCWRWNAPSAGVGTPLLSLLCPWGWNAPAIDEVPIVGGTFGAAAAAAVVAAAAVGARVRASQLLGLDRPVCRGWNALSAGAGAPDATAGVGSSHLLLLGLMFLCW